MFQEYVWSGFDFHPQASELAPYKCFHKLLQETMWQTQDSDIYAVGIDVWAKEEK